MRLAAVRGREIRHRLLAAACELPDDDSDLAVRDAVEQHVLVQRAPGTLAFRHALFAEALDADLLPGERAGLHLALAEAIDREPALADGDGRAAAELAAHWLGAHRLPEALAAAVRAGCEAEAVYAFAEAGDHFARALALWARVDDAVVMPGSTRASCSAGGRGNAPGRRHPCRDRDARGGHRARGPARRPLPCRAAARAARPLRVDVVR